MHHIRLVAAGLLAFTFSTAALATKITSSKKMHFKDNALFISTHHSSSFDRRLKAKWELDRILPLMKQRGVPVIYLKDGDTPKYYAQDGNPDWAFSSRLGEYHFTFDSRELILSGGYLEICFAQTVQKTLKRIKKKIKNGASGKWKLTLVADAIYRLTGRTLGRQLRKKKGASLAETNEKQGKFLKKILREYSFPKRAKVTLSVNHQEALVLKTGVKNGLDPVAYIEIDVIHSGSNPKPI